MKNWRLWEIVTPVNGFMVDISLQAYYRGGPKIVAPSIYRIVQYKPSILRYPYFRKPPCKGGFKLTHISLGDTTLKCSVSDRRFPMWRFFKRGVPPVLIHFGWGFSLIDKPFCGNPHVVGYSMAALSGWWSWFESCRRFSPQSPDRYYQWLVVIGE